LIGETRFEALLLDLALGPGERAGTLVVAGDEGIDMRLELIDTLEGRTAQRLCGQDREPNFDLVEPRRMGRGVVEVNPRMAGQPQLTLRLVGGKIVDDDAMRRAVSNLVGNAVKYGGKADVTLVSRSLPRPVASRSSSRTKALEFRGASARRCSSPSTGAATPAIQARAVSVSGFLLPGRSSGNTAETLTSALGGAEAWPRGSSCRSGWMGAVAPELRNRVPRPDLIDRRGGRDWPFGHCNHIRLRKEPRRDHARASTRASDYEAVPQRPRNPDRWRSGRNFPVFRQCETSWTGS